MFLKNKYAYWYYRLIIKARKRGSPDGYVERHHAFPKSLGGGNSAKNIVRLTFREHFLAHWLLTKCTEGDYRLKMCRAFGTMGQNRDRRKVTGWQYDKAHSLRRELGLTEEHKRKISETKRSTPRTEKEKVAWAEAVAKGNRMRKGKKKTGKLKDQVYAMIAKKIGAPRTPKEKRKLSVAGKAKWRDPIYRAKMEAHLIRLNSGKKRRVKTKGLLLRCAGSAAQENCG